MPSFLGLLAPRARARSSPGLSVNCASCLLGFSVAVPSFLGLLAPRALCQVLSWSFVASFAAFLNSRKRFCVSFRGPASCPSCRAWPARTGYSLCSICANFCSRPCLLCFFFFFFCAPFFFASKPSCRVSQPVAWSFYCSCVRGLGLSAPLGFPPRLSRHTA